MNVYMLKSVIDIKNLKLEEVFVILLKGQKKYRFLYC